MRTYKSKRAILSLIQQKESLLKDIVDSSFPHDPTHWKRHLEKVTAANAFLRELPEVIDVLYGTSIVKCGSITSFESEVKNAEYAIVEFDGTYCKLATIMNFPSKYYVLWTASIKSL